jgi:hypothetical protein
MKILNTLKKTLSTLCLLGITHVASAGMISWDPTPALGNVDDDIVVNLVWTGGTDEYLGDWDIDISFDSSIVEWSQILWDPDGGLDSMFIDVFGVSGPQGALNLFAVSLDFPEDIIANQNSLGNTFRLVEFTFKGIANGETALSFGDTTFGDEFGLLIEPGLQNGRICIGPDGCAAGVPEPISIALLGIGLAGLGWSRRKHA